MSSIQSSGNAFNSLDEVMRRYRELLSASQRLASSAEKMRKQRQDEEVARQKAKRLKEQVNAALKAVPEGDAGSILRIEKTIQRELLKANNEVDRAIERGNREEEKSEQAYEDLLAVLTSSGDSPSASR